MMEINKALHLDNKIFTSDISQEPIRKGFGQGLTESGHTDTSIVALSADLTESTQMEQFKDNFPDRFIEIGVAEQNLVTVASGLAAVGKKPFITSYAGFSPGRNWEQIRTTVCLNDRNVKIVGAHAGVSVGPDGATHQMLEDIALMRVLPNMVVVVPSDSVEARKATIQLAKTNKPAYIRLARDKTAVYTTEKTPFRLGIAQLLIEGSDITMVACGPLVYEAMLAAESLSKQGISAEVINCHTIKPIDETTILKSANKTRVVITIEEAQVTGGLGGAISELLSEKLPTRVFRIGVQNRFGQSGTVAELWKEYGLDSISIHNTAKSLVESKLNA
ncbi:MAG: transketolase C-terminal domain-containing protein [Candidatus Saccharibacteria bacterium]